MASLDLVVTVTKPSWPVGQEAQGQSLHHCNPHLPTTRHKQGHVSRIGSGSFQMTIGVKFILARGSQPGPDEFPRDLPVCEK